MGQGRMNAHRAAKKVRNYTAIDAQFRNSAGAMDNTRRGKGRSKSDVRTRSSVKIELRGEL